MAEPPEFLTITVDNPERFPEGALVGLFRANNIVGDVIPWARALETQYAPGPVVTRMEFTTPVPFARSFGRGWGASPVPEHTPFALAAVVNGQARMVRVMAEHGG
jgi:hypothetical protein